MINLYSMISHPGISSIIFGIIFFKYPFTPGFRIRRRYFGIQTTWYSVRYALWPENLISISPLYHIVAYSFTHGLKSVELCPSGFLEEVRTTIVSSKIDILGKRWLPSVVTKGHEVNLVANNKLNATTRRAAPTFFK